MSTTVRALLRAAHSCVAEAARADRLGQHRYAGALRQSARNALAEIRAIIPPAVAADRETAARQETARAYAAVLMKGLH
jgi:hypothetical protein